MAQAAIALRAKLAQVFWRTGRTGEARGVLGEAVRLVGQGDALQRSRVQTLLGRVEIDEFDFDAALAALTPLRSCSGIASGTEMTRLWTSGLN